MYNIENEELSKLLKKHAYTLSYIIDRKNIAKSINHDHKSLYNKHI